MENLFAGIGYIIFIAIFVLVIMGMWKIFEKAGKPGWASLIPFYNIYTILQIIGKPAWWLILLLIPLANIVVLVMVYLGLAKSFGKDTLYGLGMIFLGPIFIPLLGFGDDQYIGPNGVPANNQTGLF